MIANESPLLTEVLGDRDYLKPQELLANTPWACRTCVSGGRATEGRLRGEHGDVLAWFDEEKTCVDCGSTFVFSGAEQKYWYEELGFPVYSRPKRCVACRRAYRRQRETQKDLQTALSTYDPAAPEELLTIAGLYLELDRLRKAREFLNRARNKLDRSEATIETREQLAQMETLLSAAESRAVDESDG